MGFVPLSLPPGVVLTDSPYAAKGRYLATDKVRFSKGLPEKIGGITELVDAEFAGIARGARTGLLNSGAAYLVFGTACNLYTLRATTLSAITPYRYGAEGVTLNNPFTTVVTETLVTVTWATHGIDAAGKYVTFDGATAVGGITIDGDYIVQEIVGPNEFTIEHTSAATSSASGGGTVTASAEINCGDQDPEYLLGWGIGGWGEGGWGVARPIESAELSEPLIWSIANYGQDMIISPSEGAIYYYDGSDSLTRPVIVDGAPAQSRFVFVTPERFIFALGCTTLSAVKDNMTVRWADVDDNTDWIPSSVNRANERRLQGGGRLIAGTGLVQGLSLVWSDTTAFTFQFNGGDTVYDSRPVGSNCGLVAPHAFATVDGAAFWMGQNTLHMFNGSFVQPIPNVEDVRDWVYRRLNRAHLFKAIAFHNQAYNEIWFLFPTVASEPDTYVAVNLNNFAWINGTLTRTAVDRYSTGDGRPVMFGTDGKIYSHESLDTPDDNGAAMEAYIEAAPFDMAEGNTSVDVFGFVPDFERQSGVIEVRLYGKDHPRDTEMMVDVLTVQEADILVDARLSGRQVGVRYTSRVVGGDFRLGSPKLEVSGAGIKRGSKHA